MQRTVKLLAFASLGVLAACTTVPAPGDPAVHGYFRIGHMGDHMEPDLEALLGACQIPPSVNQVELSPYLQRDDLVLSHSYYRLTSTKLGGNV